MEPGPAQGSAASPATERTRGWFLRMPVWARIAIPVVALVAATAIIVAVLMPRASSDPVEEAESACRSAVLAELESHDMSTREFSVFEVTTTDPDTYLVRGDAAFRDSADDDGTERRVQVRCTVRVEDVEMQAPNIRFSEPISAE